MKLIRIGVDLAKKVFQLYGVDRSEKPVWRRKLVRADWLKALLAQIAPGCEIGMEACSGAHHWARQLQAQGSTVNGGFFHCARDFAIPAGRRRP